MENIRKSKQTIYAKAPSNKCVFSIFLNCANEVEDQILMGRLFQSRGAATEKARLPQELVEGGSERSNLVLERSGRDMKIKWFYTKR